MHYSTSKRSSSLPVARCSMATLLFLGAIVVQLSQCIKFSVGIEHDLSGPTYGLEGKSSSQIRYDDRNGLNLAGTIGDILGPPIKIANGLGNVIQGSNMAGIGTSLRGGGALLGFDAKLLETAGAGNLLKGGLLWNGAQAKANVAGQLAGPKGQKIASIIEVPVKVVAMKDLAAGKALSTVGQVKHATAQAADSKGQALLLQGQALKTQGLNQIVQGANEGVQNIGNMVQKTTENVNSAIRLFPLVWDMQQQQYAAEAAKGQQQQHPIQQQNLVSTPHQLGGAASHGSSSLTGGSLFGGLSSILPGMGQQFGPNHGYAALWNATSPLTNLLMNPAVNPFFFPLTNGPLGQAIVAKQPIGTHESAAYGGGSSGSGGSKTGEDEQSMSFNYNLFPGLKYSEHISSSNHLPNFNIRKQIQPASKGTAEQHPVQQQQQQQVQQVPQQQEAKP